MAFAFGFFIQSIFGFGGVIIALSILSPFVDIKELVFLGLILSFTAKLAIFITGIKSFSLKRLVKILVFLIPGVFLGAHILAIASTDLLLKSFAVFLIIYVIYSLFIKELEINKLVQYLLLFLGGIIQGIFGTGGPFAVVALKDSYKDKSEMRTTISIIFLISDIARGFQYYIQNTFDYSLIIGYWWMIALVIITVYLGFKVHLKISNDIFRKGVLILLLISGIVIIFS